jgi:hypothetical protein
VDHLRRDVIEAFDESQAELGDLRGVRERLLGGDYAGRRPRSDNRFQLSAGIAAILIAALVIATFVFVRAMSQPSPANKLNVPASTPLILFHDPARAGQIDGLTWDGRSAGSVGSGGVDGGTSNPAGTLYASATDIQDRTGRSVGPLTNASVNPFHVTWADDEVHYCQVVPAAYKGVGPGPGLLQLVLPGGKVTNVTQIGTFPPASQNQPPPSVAACSVENDRAVVLQAATPSPLAVQDWVVQLSTGRILWTHTIKVPGSPAGVGVVSTHDALYVAETTWSSGQATATIYGPDGSAIGHLAAFVQAFSWDGSLVVTSASSGSSVSLMRWRDATVLWTGPDGFHFVGARSEPGGNRIAIAINNSDNPADLAQARTGDLYVFSTAGQLLWTRKSIYLA